MCSTWGPSQATHVLELWGGWNMALPSGITGLIMTNFIGGFPPIDPIVFQLIIIAISQLAHISTTQPNSPRLYQSALRFSGWPSSAPWDTCWLWSTSGSPSTAKWSTWLTRLDVKFRRSGYALLRKHRSISNSSWITYIWALFQEWVILQMAIFIGAMMINQWVPYFQSNPFGRRFWYLKDDGLRSALSSCGSLWFPLTDLKQSMIIRWRDVPAISYIMQRWILVVQEWMIQRKERPHGFCMFFPAKPCGHVFEEKPDKTIQMLPKSDDMQEPALQVLW